MSYAAALGADDCASRGLVSAPDPNHPGQTICVWPSAAPKFIPLKMTVTSTQSAPVRTYSAPAAPVPVPESRAGMGWVGYGLIAAAVVAGVVIWRSTRKR